MNASPVSTSTRGANTRDIRLLSRHWGWLDAQPTSASAALRALVEEACRDKDGRHRAARAKEACYYYMRDMAGDRPHFEEAVRALFANDEPELLRRIATWPIGVRTGIADMLGLAGPDNTVAGEQP